MKEKPKDIKTLDDLTPDSNNFNKHTEFGTKLLEDSLRKFGAGRSVLVDKDGNIIAGNGVVETAAAIGMEDVVVVKTDGTELIAVKRTDVDIESEMGRSMALADNAVAVVDLNWDIDELKKAVDTYGLDMNDWRVKLGNDPVTTITETDDTKEISFKMTPEQYAFMLDKLRQYGDDFSKGLMQILGL